MTSRELIIKTMKREMTERMPFAPCVDPYYLSGLDKEMNVIEGICDINGEVIVRHVMVYEPDLQEIEKRGEWDAGYYSHKRNQSGTLEIIQKRVKNEYTEQIITPYGTLSAKKVETNALPGVWFPKEHFLKTEDDIKAYQYYVEHCEYRSTEKNYTEMDQMVGDAGIATIDGPESPFQTLMDNSGLEALYYLLADYQEEMEELMDVFHEKNKQLYREFIINSEAEFVVAYEGSSTTTLSPAIFEKYCLPRLNEYADICHEAGKMLLVHMCGKLKGLKDLIAKGRFDGVIDIAPDPTGDVSLPEAYQYWGHNKIVMGGIDATHFQFFKPEEMETYVKEILQELGDCRGVFLGTGDALLRYASRENLLTITNILRNSN